MTVMRLGDRLTETLSLRLLVDTGSREKRVEVHDVCSTVIDMLLSYFVVRFLLATDTCFRAHGDGSLEARSSVGIVTGRTLL